MSRGTTTHTSSPPTVLMTTTTTTTTTAAGGMGAPRPTHPRKSTDNNIIVDINGDMFDTMTIEDSASELQRDIDLLQRLVDQVIISSSSCSSPLRQKQHQQQQQQQSQIEYQRRHNITSLPTFTNTSFHHPIGQHDLELSRKITTMTSTTSRWALSTFDSPLRNPTLTSPTKPKNFVDETSIINNKKNDGESQHRSSSLLDDDVDDYDGAMMLQQLLRQRQRKEWIRLSLSGDNAMTLSDYNPEDEAPKLPSRYVSSSVESIGVASAPPCSTNKKLLFSHSSSSSSSLLSSSSLPPLAIH